MYINTEHSRTCTCCIAWAHTRTCVHRAHTHICTVNPMLVICSSYGSLSISSLPCWKGSVPRFIFKSPFRTPVRFDTRGPLHGQGSKPGPEAQHSRSHGAQSGGRARAALVSSAVAVGPECARSALTAGMGVRFSEAAGRCLCPRGLGRVQRSQAWFLRPWRRQAHLQYLRVQERFVFALGPRKRHVAWDLGVLHHWSLVLSPLCWLVVTLPPLNVGTGAFPVAPQKSLP